MSARGLGTWVGVAYAVAALGLLALDPSDHLAAPSEMGPGLLMLSAGALWLAALSRRRTRTLAAGAVVFAFLAETGARLWLFDLAPPLQARAAIDARGTVEHHAPDPLTNHRPLPGLYQGRAHNRLGLRDARPLLHKPVDEIRVLFVGNKMVYEPWTDDERLFTRQIEAGLNARHGSTLGRRRFAVINAGFNMATSAESMLRLAFVYSELEPDLVVIMHGYSDTWAQRVGTDTPTDYANYTRPMTRRYDPRGTPRATAYARSAVDELLILWPFGDAIRGPPAGLLRAVHRLGVRPGVAPRDARYFERNTRVMVELCRGIGAAVLLVSVDPAALSSPHLELLEGNNAVLARVAADLGVPFFDLAAAWPPEQRAAARRAQEASLALHERHGGGQIDKPEPSRDPDIVARLFLEYFRDSPWFADLLLRAPAR